MAMLDRKQLLPMGFAHVGAHVRVSDKASFYGCERISIGDFSRVDDFCVISAGSGGVQIGRYVHVAAHCLLLGEARITLMDFSGLSGRVSVYSSSDDYTGRAMTNPTVPPEACNVESAPVVLGEHVIVGAGSVILPGAELGTGVAVGALCLVKGVLSPFTIYAGNPCKAVCPRSRDMIDIQNRMQL